ncbi:hypothetical protein Tco_1110102 [Tanacetum coccineum]|uniref:Uncharacterized protein n=1 Tax=Tanacetum coccineum TaxID=301880 RepID=A0ABQ5II46_9ASTR
MMNASYLSRLNPRASAQNKDAKSHKTTKRYMPVAKSSASKKSERQTPTGHRFSNKKTTTVPEKTINLRSCLRWKLTGKILKTVGLRLVPTGKLFNSCTGKVDSEPTHGSMVDIPHIHACKQTLGLSAGKSFNGHLNADALYNAKQENLRVWGAEKSSLGLHCSNERLFTSVQASFFIKLTSDQNLKKNSEFKSTAITVKFKAGSKSCSLSKQDSYITTRVGITIPPSHSNAEDNRHNMKCCKRHKSQDCIDDKDIDKGSKSRSQSMKEQTYNREQRERPRPHELNDKSNLIDLMKESMSPLARASHAKYHWGIAFVTGLKRFTDPVTKLRMKHTNYRVRIPRGLYPHRIEAKLTKKQVGGKWILVREVTMISKDGEISKFPGYHSSEEEEPTEQPRALNKYGFDEDEPLKHEESNKEVDSDLESTASSKPKCKKLKKTAKAIPDRTFRNCPYCPK